MADRQTRLPSLNALRAFEAAARNRSLLKAARELNVTPAAISQHIKALEADLGVKLVLRQDSGVELSEAALASLPMLRSALNELQEAAQQLQRKRPRRTLTLSVCPTFASVWLVPRLADLADFLREVDLRLDTTDERLNLQRDQIDLDIHIGRGGSPDIEAHALFNDRVFPVCSPRLLESGPPLASIEDLRDHNLLHANWAPLNDNMDETATWSQWFAAAGLAEMDANRGLRFSRIHIALQAASNGLGVALSNEGLAGDALREGRLVRPFELELSTGCTYYLSHSKSSMSVPEFIFFRDWLLSRIS